MPRISVRVADMAWGQRLTLELRGSQAGASKHTIVQRINRCIKTWCQYRLRKKRVAAVYVSPMRSSEQ